MNSIYSIFNNKQKYFCLNFILQINFYWKFENFDNNMKLYSNLKTMAATKRNAGLTSAIPRPTLNDEDLVMTGN